MIDPILSSEILLIFQELWVDEGFDTVLAVTPDNTRYLSLNEDESESQFVCINAEEEIIGTPEGDPPVCLDGVKVPFAPISARLGIIGMNNLDVALDWGADITEAPLLDDTEEWRIVNYTEDTHPIHLHLVMFQVIGRAGIGDFLADGDIDFIWPPDANETGWKDTIRANPGEVTLVKAKFDKEGLYVWHCHILEHEDNEMMRPYYVKSSEGEIPPPP